MDDLDPHEDHPQDTRPSVKELVARIQQQHQHGSHDEGAHSESSDDEDGPLRVPSRKGPMGDSNLVQVSFVFDEILLYSNNVTIFFRYLWGKRRGPYV